MVKGVKAPGAIRKSGFKAGYKSCVTRPASTQKTSGKLNDTIF